MRATFFAAVHAVAALQLATPTLHHASLPTLFGPEQLLIQRNFLSPELVRALVADVGSLRKRGVTPDSASAAHGSVEWLNLLPQPPAAHRDDHPIGLAGRACLLQIVDDIKTQLELGSSVPLDAAPVLKYAYYPCGGRYQRHVDGMNAGSVAREWSILLYLNQGWSPRDGGHLRVYDDFGGYTDVAPEAGTLVMFKSDAISHEVRPTTAKRLAIVGWLHRHQTPPEVDEEALTPLARAILEHYRAQGKDIKLNT